MKWSTRIKTTLETQLVSLSVAGIVLTLLITMCGNLWINLRSNHQLMDRHMTDIAASLAMTQEVQNAAAHRETEDAQQLLSRVVTQVQDLDVAAVLDNQGNVLASGSIKGGTIGLDLPSLKGDEGTTFLGDHQSSEGMERCAYAKIENEAGELLGFVAVGVYMRSIYEMVIWTVVQHFLIGFAMMALGGFSAHRLASYIKKELLGYEPQAFRRIVSQRSDIWDALEEGVMAIDDQCKIIYLNKAAKEMLQLPPGDTIGMPLHQAYPASTLDRVLKRSKPEYNVPLTSMHNAKILADRMPIRKDGKTIGAVAIFRNRTEVTKLAEDLTGVRHVADALRANTHEFMNKLHVILGLLQLQEYEKAEEYVLDLTKMRAQSLGGITGRIQAPAVAALLIGKLSRAQELRICFTLDPVSTLPAESKCLPEDAIISVVGNLIENAFDSFKTMSTAAQREVEIGIVEDHNGLLICAEDTGCGIPAAIREKIFQKGFSTKGEGRGTGLALVQNIVEAYNGKIRVESIEQLGTTITIHFPIQEEPDAETS